MREFMHADSMFGSPPIKHAWDSILQGLVPSLGEWEETYSHLRARLSNYMNPGAAVESPFREN